MECPGCGVEAKAYGPQDTDKLNWECPRCGNFELTGSAENGLHQAARVTPGAISGWIRRQNSLGLTPSIGTNDLQRLRSLSLPPFKERAEIYLQAAIKKCPLLTDVFPRVSDDLIGASYSANEADALFIHSYLVEEGHLVERANGWRIGPEGRIAADELASRRAASSQAFIAMWFSDEMMAAYRDGIEPAVLHSGYSAMMIGNKEHANKIDDEIIAEIRRSAFLIADFTGQRGGVYFEAGFAMGLGLQVVWTCRKDEIDDLHFDIRQYNCIDWSDATDLRTRLQNRITAVLGQGPVPIP